MKNVSAILILIILLFNSGCKKSENSTAPNTCKTCVTKPDALAANDNSSKGVYKGVIIGSTGTIMFDILNSGSTIKATMVLDGITTVLTAAVSWSAGQPYVSDFTGTYNGNPVSVTFSVDPTGANPVVVSSNIPGHPTASFDVYKETSSNLVECFLGSYVTTKNGAVNERGTFNVLLSRTAKLYGGSSRATTSNSSSTFGPSPINSSNQLLDDSGKILGTLNGDSISGDFIDNNNSNVDVRAFRNW
ncbi:MAG: hypothetical protein U0T73_06640 [Chitinophagales bacterium]